MSSRNSQEGLLEKSRASGHVPTFVAQYSQLGEVIIQRLCPRVLELLNYFYQYVESKEHS